MSARSLSLSLQLLANFSADFTNDGVSATPSYRQDQVNANIATNRQRPITNDERQEKGRRNEKKNVRKKKIHMHDGKTIMCIN